MSEKTVKVLTYSLWGVLFLYSFGVQWSLFYAGKFGYHDLTLLSDIFSNTAHGRGFFHITADGYSHFKLQFTPTLLLIIPLFRLFDSQYTLLALNTVSVFASLILFLKILSGLEKRAKNTHALLPFVFLILIATNRYTKNVLLSAHYEPFFLPWCALTLWALLENRHLILTLTFFLLSLGIRSDAPFFLFFECLGLYFLPNWAFKDPKTGKKRALYLSVTALLYFVLLTAIINPNLGAINNFSRWWGHLGSSPSEIILYCLKHPIYVLQELFNGGFFPINLSFFFLLLFFPGYFFFTNISATPFYLITFIERKNLFYYHSGLLLPFFYIGAAVGLLNILSWTNRLKKTTQRKVIASIFAVILVSQGLTFFDTNNGFKFRPYPMVKKPMALEIQKFLEENPRVKSVAADFGSLVFIPNSKVPILLENYQQADAIIIDFDNSALTSGSSSLREFEKTISPKYQKVHEKVGISYSCTIWLLAELVGKS